MEPCQDLVMREPCGPTADPWKKLCTVHFFPCLAAFLGVPVCLSAPHLGSPRTGETQAVPPLESPPECRLGGGLSQWVAKAALPPPNLRGSPRRRITWGEVRRKGRKKEGAARGKGDRGEREGRRGGEGKPSREERKRDSGGRTEAG